MPPPVAHFAAVRQWAASPVNLPAPCDRAPSASFNGTGLNILELLSQHRPQWEPVAPKLAREYHDLKTALLHLGLITTTRKARLPPLPPPPHPLRPRPRHPSRGQHGTRHCQVRVGLRAAGAAGTEAGPQPAGRRVPGIVVRRDTSTVSRPSLKPVA